jgi:two-component system, cell cycle sensor histidine kinase and response regulator CckA
VVEVFQIADLVDEMTHLLQTSVSKKVVLRISHDPGLPPMEGDATQIRQIIMNLVINASEAIGDNEGVVRVSTGLRQCTRDDLDTTYLSQDLPEGPYLCIEVTDTGCGMNEETIEHLFEPFFTTKFTGRGLGMSAVLGIVRGHKGTLNVKSVVGQGTTFEILLPPSDKGAKADNEQKPALPAVWRGSGLVLLVDDEESIRRLGATMLERMGFDVITAADGLEAVGLYQREAGRVSLVLLDLTMPHMDGEETFHALREIDPGVRVVMASGYSGHEIEARFGGQGLLGVIQKPYTMAALRGTLSRALGPG